MRRCLLLCVVLCLSAPSLEAQDFFGKNASDWITQLKTNKEWKQRRNAAFALGKLGKTATSAVADIKIAYINEKEVKVREAMVYALGEISQKNLVLRKDSDLEKLLLDALAADDAHLRRSAAFALGCLATKTPATRRALDTALSDQEPMVRQNATFALAQFKEDAIPSLKKALGDKDSLVKRDAASVLGQMQDGDKVHDLLPELLPLCEDADSEVRRAALSVLVLIVDVKDEKAIDFLASAMKKPDLENQRNAAIAISNIGGPRSAVALPVLLEAAKNGDIDSRRQAVLAFRNLGKFATSAVPDLVGFLRDDPDAKVRKHAALSLGGVGAAAEPAVPVFVQKIQDAKEDQAVRIECAMALAKVGKGPTSKNIVPTLLQVLRDERHDGKVRERVMWALRVHNEDLRNFNGTKEAFAAVMTEAVNLDNKMLRYDCAYMLGMIWQAEAPKETLNVLLQFLEDPNIKVYVGTTSIAGGGKLEGKAGQAKVSDDGIGDGRVMATDALAKMGKEAFGNRADIIRQLRTLAGDATVYAPLREKAANLLK